MLSCRLSATARGIVADRSRPAVRAFTLLLPVVALALIACKSEPRPVVLATGCRHTPDGSCAVFRQATTLDDGAPLARGTLIVPFTGSIRLRAVEADVIAVTATVNLESRLPDLKLVRVSGIRIDPHNARQLLIELDSLLADGTAVELPEGAIVDAHGRPLGALTITVRTSVTPFEVALADTVWQPTDPALFKDVGVAPPRGAKAVGAVRQELAARLRLRPNVTDAEVERVLAQFDSDVARQKVPDHRVRAGLLLLTGTSAEYAIDYLLSETNRKGVPFAPVEVEPIGDFGAYAAVFFAVGAPTLLMIVDTGLAADSLEGIAAALAHEVLHSSLGGGSASQETLAMAITVRVYEEFLLWDPTLAQTPTAFTRELNVLTLALRNSGRFSFPRAGILPRPGVEDALHGTAVEPVRSFKDLLFRPDVYGSLRQSGDVGTEVLEAYYHRLSGEERTRISFDVHTLKLFDDVIDAGFTDEQVLAIADALKLRPAQRTATQP
jgi:hypothetical protein